MTQFFNRLAGAFAIALIVSAAISAQPKANSGINVPVTYYKLPNGL